MERLPFERRYAALKLDAFNWWTQWKDLSKYIKPTRGFFNDTPNWGKAPDYKTLIDGTATRSVRILASGMTSGLTSPSRPWFKLGLPDEELMHWDPVRTWLDECQEKMMGVFSRSNIYGVLHSTYEELGVFGVSASILLEDFDDILRGRTFTAGEYVLGTSSDGRVNTFGKESWLSVGGLVKEFGIENCPPNIQSLFKNGEVDKWFKVMCLIEPNDNRIPDKKDLKNMKFRAVYWVDGSPADTYLRVGGFEDFPVLAPRWDVTTTADSYGKGPGWDALGDVKQLQKMQKDKLIALDKLVNPPMQKDATIQGDVNSLPGGITFSSSTAPNAGVRPAYQINPDMPGISAEIRYVQQAISSTFYADLFMMLAQSDRREMTAREVVERHEEKLLMLGPVLERLETELLDPLIDRTFNLMLQANVLPPPPKELEGMDIDVEYISMLAQAQKMVGTTAIEQVSRFAGSLAGAKPEVLDVMDFDSALMEYGEMLGLPPNIIRSKEAVQAMRAQRAQAQAQQQQMQMQAQQAQMLGQAVQGAKVLSDTQIGNNSALDAIIGRVGGTA